MPYPGSKKKRENYDVNRTDKPCDTASVDTVGKTENFFTANVKLITAVVTIAVLMALIGPWSVFRIKRQYDAMREQNRDDVLISAATLDALVARGPALTWRDFDGFSYRVISDGIVYICQYDVEGGDYYLWVTSAAKGTSIESVLLVDVQNDYRETEIKAVE